jgi:hypothetical protein
MVIMSKEKVHTKLNATIEAGNSESKSTSTGAFVNYSGSNSTLESTVSVSISDHLNTKSKASIINAVYGYLQAIRSLDRTDVTVPEISAALALPLPEVINALKNLRGKGVKIKA